MKPPAARQEEILLSPAAQEQCAQPQKAQGGSGRFRNVDDGCQVILRCRAFPEAEAGYRWGTLVPVQGCPAADIELVQISGLGHVGPGYGLSGAVLRNEHAVGSPCLNGESQ